MFHGDWLAAWDITASTELMLVRRHPLLGPRGTLRGGPDTAWPVEPVKPPLGGGGKATVVFRVWGGLRVARGLLETAPLVRRGRFWPIFRIANLQSRWVSGMVVGCRYGCWLAGWGLEELQVWLHTLSDQLGLYEGRFPNGQ